MFYFINFKAYKAATGNKALNLSIKIEKVKKETNKEIIPIPQFTDIKPISEKTNLKIYSQSIDPISPGSHTGSILPESIKEAGGIGTLLNHSEKRLRFEKLKKCIEKAKELGLKTLVCCENKEEAGDILPMEPDYIAFEVPELIGTGRSISKEKPESVKDFVKVIEKGNSIPLCGAGISSGEDVKIAKNLGTKGVLVASAVIKAEDQERALRNLVIDE